MTRSLSETTGSTSYSLIERVAAHDDEAWQRFVWLYGPLVEFWIRRSGLQSADAQDVSQEVFQAVAKGIHKFDKDNPKSKFRAWLRTITRNKTIDYLRVTEDKKRKGMKPPEGGTTANQRLHSIVAQESRSEDADEADAVQQLRLRGLHLVRNEFKERTWQMFWRVTVDGHSTRAVAQEMGVSSAAVRVAKWRVLRRLREELGELEP